ncbi:MAG TPA: hypothetical protein VGQ19_05870 [Burkholderiales bacterium]|nr:hypothetical protein [Burkholderiales bacterium]
MHDEFRLRLGIGAPRGGATRLVLGRKLAFELLICAGNVRVVAQIISKAKSPLFFRAAGLDEVYVMGMRPPGWSVEKRAKGVICMGSMAVTQSPQENCIPLDGVKVFNRDLDVDDWLGCETWNGGRAMVVDPNCVCT